MRALGLLLLLLASCAEVTPPPRYAVVRLQGHAYQRGLQHGQQLSSQIRSFYTRMLTTSLVPYLGRQQADVAAFLPHYGKPPYDTPNRFARQVLLESAHALEAGIAPELRAEMRGIADGSGLPYDDVLVLNTFLDTTLAARAVTLFLQQTQAPRLVSVAVPRAGDDGRDQDDDGQTDEPDEVTVDGAPSATATWVELAPDASLVFVLQDPDGVDPKTVRLRAGGQVWQVGDPGVTASELTDGGLQVAWQPSQPWPSATTVAVVLTASDLKVSTQPPPEHAHAMLPVQLSFTTVGTGKLRPQVRNQGGDDGLSQPPALAFAVRGAATVDGQPLLAHHFALLDAGVAHEHTVLQLHQPDAGPAFAVIGWAGVVYGMSGMNAHGLAMAANPSDTLNNPMTKQFLDHLLAAKLVSTGTPIGFALREALAQAHTTGEAVALLQARQHTFGWNVLVADAQGQLAAVEVHADVMQTQPPLAYGPDAGRASVGKDDLRIASHFVARPDDLAVELLFEVKPQRFWTPYWQPSLRAWLGLGDAIAPRLGQFDVATAQAVLRRPELVDQHDSMTAVVFEPGRGRLHVALGTVPATASSFDAWQVPVP